ncbi:MBOAT family O-acyltransferase [Emticicia sp. SJ17W-69]|uniref:MBOAT family O-acyltransferase n=1 Tax=Emticicia sp. SJ17W-69 TaxID=3421657 RepID=UPI003EBAC1A8
MSINLSITIVIAFIALVSVSILQKKIKAWRILLFGSLIFYAFNAGLTGLIFILFYTLFVFFAGKNVEKKAFKAQYFVLIICTLLPLLFLKFSFLFVQNRTKTLEILGISYITFNALSYLFDIKKSYIVAENSYERLLLYLSYFPYVSAGPLQRYKKTIRQFTDRIEFSNENFSAGFRLVLWGIFKNLVLAQKLKVVVDRIMDEPSTYQGIIVLIGGLLFFLQLYCDFSSYIDIYQGISRIFGIRLNPNFGNRVYLSNSRQNFWKGWHITLNHWFRDYFFFAIAKNIKSKNANNIATFITFLLIGLWHEISIKFLIWSILNATWILLERNYQQYFEVFSTNFRKIAGVFYHLIIAAFLAIFFRSNDFKSSINALFLSSNFRFLNETTLIKQFIFIPPLFLFMDFINRKANQQSIDEYIATLSFTKRWLIYILLTILILFFGLTPQQNFYYTRF